MTVREALACPDPRRLAQFRHGELGDDEMEGIADHLANCSTCASEVARSSAGDVWLAHLRRSLRQAPLPEEEACVAVAARVRDLLSDDSDATVDPPGRPFPIPDFLGPYEIVESLNGGGMGDIYKARHTRLKRFVALKTLTPDRAEDSAAIARFDREMEASGAVPEHPNLVRATDADKDHGINYLVMEFIPGVDLSRLVARGPLPLADACELARQAALGLAHLHAHGVVHRDVKPSNLMLAADGTLKVLDLGLALLPGGANTDRSLTGTWTLMGTADYMAPEQIFDAHSVGPAADLYGLGCTLFKLLTGRAPFEEGRRTPRAKKLRAHSMEPPPRLRDQRSDVPPALDELVAGLLAKQPEERGTARALADALVPFTAGHAIFDLLASGAALPSSGAMDSTQPRPGATLAFGRSSIWFARRTWILTAVCATLLLAAVIIFIRANALRGVGGQNPDDTQTPILTGRWVYPFQGPKLKPLVFTDGLDGSAVHQDAGLDQVSLNYFGSDVLINCGEAPTDTRYQVEVQIRQAQWSTKCGLFFGYEELGVADGIDQYQYQYIALHPVATNPPRYEFVRFFVRKRASPRNKGEATVELRPLHIMRADPPKNREQYQLSIRCDGFGLQDVRWNGNPIPELTAPEIGAKAPVPKGGRFGIYQTQGAAVYQSLRFFLGNPAN